MKKLIGLLAVLLMCMGMVACSDEGDQEETMSEGAAKVEADETAEETVEEVVEEETTEATDETEVTEEAGDVTVMLPNMGLINGSFEDPMDGEWGFWQSEGGMYDISEEVAFDGSQSIIITNSAEPFAAVWQNMPINVDGGLVIGDSVKLDVAFRGDGSNEGEVKVMLESVDAAGEKTAIGDSIVAVSDEEWVTMTVTAPELPGNAATLNVVFEITSTGSVYFDAVNLEKVTPADGYDIGNMGFESAFDWKTWVPSGDVAHASGDANIIRTGAASLKMNDKNSVWKEYNFEEANVPQVGVEAQMSAWIYVGEAPTQFLGDSTDLYDFVIKLVGFTDEGGVKTVFTEQYMSTDTLGGQWVEIVTPYGEITACDRIQFVLENNSGVEIYVDDIVVSSK